MAGSVVAGNVAGSKPTNRSGATPARRAATRSAVAERISMVPPDLVALNKRTVHRAMESMGLRTAIRIGTDICALGIHQPSMAEFIGKVRKKGLTEALQERDAPFGDYRTTQEH